MGFVILFVLQPPPLGNNRNKKRIVGQLFQTDNIKLLRTIMILSEFAKFLQEHNEELLMRKTTPIKLLPMWLKTVINKNPKTNIDKIVHKEIMYCENPQGDYLIVGKSDSGRILVSALIKFAKSYENYNHAKWVEITEKSYHKPHNTGKN